MDAKLPIYFFIKPHIALELSLAVNPTPVVKYLLVHKRRLEEAEVYEESMHKNKKEL
jgi:hypothetical protein